MFTLIEPVIRPVKQNQLHFSIIEINQAFPAPRHFQCFADQIQVQKLILVAVTDRMTDYI